MLTSHNANHRFDPSRFSSEPPVQDRKKVRWALPLSDTIQEQPIVHHTRINITSSSPVSWYKFYGRPLLSSLPLLLIVLYLLIRDGWVEVFFGELLHTTTDLGTPPWFRSFYSYAPATTIPPDIRSYVDHEVARVTKKPVPYRDFALVVDGGYVIGELTVPLGSPCPPGIFCPTDPVNAIVEDPRIGQCWFVQRTNCQLGLALPAQVRPTFVTVEHIPKEIAASPGQAPRQMVLWGLVEGDDNNSQYHQHLAESGCARSRDRDAPPQTTDMAHWVILSDFVYDIHTHDHIQTFPIAQCIRKSNLHFGIVVLEVVDNWGAESTCLYRVRIHGEPVP